MHIPLEDLGLPRGQLLKVVEQSLAIISQQCNRIQSVTQIAYLVGVNYHTLRSRFRRDTRLIMEECLIRNRVFLAYPLILESSKQTKEIA